MQGRYNNNNNRDFGRTPPVNVGDELDVKIEAVGEKGDGVAKKDGFVIFVPNVKEGQLVKIKVTRVLRKVGFGEVVGEAESVPEQAAPKKQEEEMDNYSPENDSEDFGDDSSSEDSSDEGSFSDDDSDDFGDEEEKN